MFLAVIGYHLEKTMRLLRRSTNRSIFWLRHKSGNADEPGCVPSIETNSSRKEQRLESTKGAVRTPISTFPGSRVSPVLQHWNDRCHAAKSTSLDFNLYGTQFLCFWITPMGLRRFKMACWVTPNDSANSSSVWLKPSASNASISESSKIFSSLPPCRSSTPKSPLLKR